MPGSSRRHETSSHAVRVVRTLRVCELFFSNPLQHTPFSKAPSAAPDGRVNHWGTPACRFDGFVFFT